MNIAVVGLGLIGGSLCKAIKHRTKHLCFGLDKSEETLHAALNQEAIDRAIKPEDLSQADLTLVCLHPRQTIDFILENAAHFRPGSIVADVCGVKKAVVDQVTLPLREKGVAFVGTHPMAGREFSGFAYSLDSLFDRASFIITPSADTPAPSIDAVEALAKEIGFARIVLTTPQEHDRIIAFTSQLAHVVSNAYVKSSTLKKQGGFTGGSFQDLTRVAKLNEDMWTTLFLMNRDPLLAEIDCILEKLTEYRQAIANEDADGLRTLLREGRELKEESLLEAKESKKAAP